MAGGLTETVPSDRSAGKTGNRPHLKFRDTQQMRADLALATFGSSYRRCTVAHEVPHPRKYQRTTALAGLNVWMQKWPEYSGPFFS